MVENSINKKKKSYAFVGLIVLTIVVVVSVICVMYFVNKYAHEEETIKLDIKETAHDEKFEFTVTNIEKLYSSDGDINIKVYVTYKAIERSTLKEKYFCINGQKPISSNGIRSVNEGETIEFSLTYSVPSNKLLFFEYKNYKVALGSV